MPEGATKQRKRLGRGGGSGTGKTSGKGHKGQNARSGGGVRPGFEGGQMPLYRRIARRGFSNYPFKKEYFTVNLDVLTGKFDAGSTVDLQALREKGLIGKNTVDVKVLGRGEIDKAVTIRGLSVSAGARTKIEAAGGTIEETVTETTEG
jgi:large subunit ribosomal protein L15